jgi:hypothetical protein
LQVATVGLPLCPVDVAELECREWYLALNANVILEWARHNAAVAYGGYRVDSRAGGVIYVGFTSSSNPVRRVLL